jgi:hypothetical protein
LRVTNNHKQMPESRVSKYPIGNAIVSKDTDSKRGEIVVCFVYVCAGSGIRSIAIVTDAARCSLYVIK